MPSKDYYEILGINKNASPDEIKASFRRLARQYHPDVCKEPGTDKKFKEINTAYQVLGDERKRHQYDTFGSVGPESSPFGSGSINIEDIGDIFDTFFGGRASRRPRGPEPGNDLRYDLSLTLEQAYHGGEKEINIRHSVICEKCKGKGSEDGRTIKCQICGGAGQVQQSQRTIFGSFAQIVTCTACSGRGETITNPCKSCGGSGIVSSGENIKVNIPPGIDSGYRLRVTGSGDAGERGARPGNLYVFITVKPHAKLNRRGDDLFISEKIDFVSATLGDEVDVALFDEKIKVKIPPGTQPNTVIRTKGKGMPRIQGSGRGDLFVEIQVEIPTRLSKEQIDLLKKIKGLPAGRQG